MMETQASPQEIFARRPRATVGILGLCVAIWGLMALSGHGDWLLPSDEVAVRFGAQENGNMVLHHQYWRLLSAAFVHFGLVHLAFNGYALWILGSFQERFFGTGRFLAIYLVAALAGNLATWAFLPPGFPSAGASGAVFGLLGAQLVVERLGTLHFMWRRKWWQGVLPWIVLNLALGLGFNLFSSNHTIQLNNYAHVGGLLGGTVVAVVLRGRGTTRRWDLPALLGWALAVAALWSCAVAIYQGIVTSPGYILYGNPFVAP